MNFCIQFLPIDSHRDLLQPNWVEHSAMNPWETVVQQLNTILNQFFFTRNWIDHISKRTWDIWWFLFTNLHRAKTLNQELDTPLLEQFFYLSYLHIWARQPRLLNFKQLHNTKIQHKMLEFTMTYPRRKIGRMQSSHQLYYIMKPSNAINLSLYKTLGSTIYSSLTESRSDNSILRGKKKITKSIQVPIWEKMEARHCILDSKSFCF